MAGLRGVIVDIAPLRTSADYRSASRWAQRDIDFCRTIAGQAALAVRNAQLYEDLRTRVDKDPLTGVLNHRAFYERLDTLLAEL